MSLFEKILDRVLPLGAVILEAFIALVLIVFIIPYGLGKLKLGTTINGIAFAVLFSIWLVYYIKVLRARI